MTKLMQRMREELVRRHYAESTITRTCGPSKISGNTFRSGSIIGPDDIRRYQVHLLEERKLGVGTVVNHISALRFLYVRVLKRREMKEDLPYPKHRRRLPTVLSQEEVSD